MSASRCIVRMSGIIFKWHTCVFLIFSFVRSMDRCQASLLGIDTTLNPRGAGSWLPFAPYPATRGFFYEICDAEQPARDENYRAEGAARARDELQDWRERLNAQESGRGGLWLIRLASFVFHAFPPFHSRPLPTPPSLASPFPSPSDSVFSVCVSICARLHRRPLAAWTSLWVCLPDSGTLGISGSNPGHRPLP